MTAGLYLTGLVPVLIWHSERRPAFVCVLLCFYSFDGKEELRRGLTQQRAL